jgi:hypothetical protein
MIVSDNGTELTSNAILSWQQEHDVEWHYIAPRVTPNHRRREDRLQHKPTTLEPQRAHTN